ncbi:MAG: tRNA (N6-threonylcarbamoyladenosine(37)-N6)-methyltransferase TrmO [Candidatus Thermoplasmatota archaeon]
MEITPIGIIHSPYKNKEEIPIQAYLSEEVGEIEVFDDYVEGLKDIEGFSHIVIVYFFHLSPKEHSLLVKTYLDTVKRGVFATRHPNRPNRLGISTVELMRPCHN